MPMTDHDLPVLYSFRRCPYAMRARLAIANAEQRCELREVVLRNKPAEMIAASPKGTVPVWVDADGTVRDESLEIMLWALGQNDPDRWLRPECGTLDEMLELIGQIDGPFKYHLDRYKYPPRYLHENDGAGVDPVQHRDAAFDLLQQFEERLGSGRFLFGNRPSLADMATAPFIRQYANTDRAWFDAQDAPRLQAWLGAFLESERFQAVMEKYAPWESGRPGVLFGQD